MSRTLRNYVHVIHPETGAGVWLAPNVEVPAWAHEAITNPKAWNADPDGPEADETPAVAEPVKKPRGSRPKADKTPEVPPAPPADPPAPKAGDGDGDGDKTPPDAPPAD